jgi:uncharacterized protein (DUF1015 family)
MVEITAFRALRYAPSFATSLSDVVAPPYDVIAAAELRRLWERDPYNVVRLILPAGDLPPAERDRGYQLAPQRLRTWKERGVLVPDEQPSLYLYRQRFRLPSGEARTRQGFFALARLTEWGEGIHRHELTLPGPISDRVQLLDACQANLSSVFGLYSDPRQEVIGLLTAQVGGLAPMAEAVDDRGVWHGLWQVSDPRAVQRVAALLRERPLIVADGHHRYTAALQYRDRRHLAGPNGGHAAPWDYVLCYLGAVEDPGLVILPTHQALRGLDGASSESLLGTLGGRFALHEEPALAALLERLSTLADAPEVVLGAVVQGSRYYLLQAPRPERSGAPEDSLDVSALRRWAVEPLLGASADLEAHLRYTHEAPEAAAWVSTGQADVAFILRPTPLTQVRSVALAGRVMPQKSTYFYPKLLSGLVFYDYACWRPEVGPIREWKVAELSSRLICALLRRRAAAKQRIYRLAPVAEAACGHHHAFALQLCAAYTESSASDFLPCLAPGALVEDGEC